MKFDLSRAGSIRTALHILYIQKQNIIPPNSQATYLLNFLFLFLRFQPFSPTSFFFITAFTCISFISSVQLKLVHLPCNLYCVFFFSQIYLLYPTLKLKHLFQRCLFSAQYNTSQIADTHLFVVGPCISLQLFLLLLP